MSSFGKIFRITTFGESHCKGVGVIVEGCPAKLDLIESDIQPQLTRRRPGQCVLNTPRDEKDKVTILSGTENGKTLGTPISAIVYNQDFKPQDYKFASEYVPRPSHADYTYHMKYGIHASSGGGRSSARETISRVIGGAIADKYLKQEHNIDIIAWVSSIGNINYDITDEYKKNINRKDVDKSILRCPDLEISKEMEDLVGKLRDEGDSIGGTVTCICRNVPPGLGEPCFDKLEALLAHGMLSIPATKGFEIGSGFSGTLMQGSKHNDLFVKKTKGIGTLTNNSGGIQGGISNGEDIVFKVAFKPPATIKKSQITTTLLGEKTELEGKGRHDPCVVNRAVPIVESMASLVLMDCLLIQNYRK